MNRTILSNRVTSHAFRAVLAAAVTATPALAVDKSWLVDVGNWGNAADWNPVGMPNAGDNVFIGNTAGAENGWLTLNVNANAANLSLTDGMALLTNTHAITVSGNTTISGRNETPASVVYYSRIRIENGPNASDFRTNNLTVTNQARFWLDGGTARVDGLFDIQDASFFDGNGVLNLYGNGAVALRNNGRISPDAGGLTINQNGTGRIDLDGTVADNGLINITTGTLDGSPFASMTMNGDGLADAYNERVWLGGGNSLTMNLAEGWTLGTGSEVRFFKNTAGNDIVARVNGGTVTIQGSLDIYNDAYARFNAPVIMTGSAAIAQDGTLDFKNSTTLDGASISMADGANAFFTDQTTVVNATFSSETPGVFKGVAVFSGPTNWRGTMNLNDTGSFHEGQQTVSLATVINGPRADLDGGLGSDTVWNVNAPLSLNVDYIDTDNNNFDNGTININASNVLTSAYIQMDVFNSGWRMNGTMNVTGPGGGLVAQTVRGDTLRLGGNLNVDGNNSFTAPLEVLAGGTATINANSSLRLDGGTIATPNELQGGRIVGPGTLRATGNHALVGHGTIAANIDFSGTAELRAKDGFLRITGPITSAGVIGTADATGILNVTNPWNTGVAQRVELLGGQITGAAITNDGQITGHGTVFPLSLSNSGSISAVGGDLLVNTVANSINLGALGTGEVHAVGGNVTIADVPLVFLGRAVVGAGRSLTLSEGWVVGSAGTLQLTGTPASPATIAGGGQTVAGTTIVSGSAQFDLGTLFHANSRVQTAAAGDALALLKSGFVAAGASFTGPGQLRNASTGSLILDDASTVGITLINSGPLGIDSGTTTGIASAQRFQQTSIGSTAVQLAGPVPGTGFDRLNVATTAALAGQLDLSVLAGYDPAYLASHEVLRADSISGVFQSVPGNQLAPNKWLAVTYDADSVLVSAALPGDANLDGSVNLDDFTALAAGFGVAGTWVTGNFNGDRTVNLDDFTPLAANFGMSLPADLPRGAAVPEPALAALVLGVTPLLGRRRTRLIGR